MSKIRIKGDTSGFVDLETSATGSNLSVTGNALKVDAINEKTAGNGVAIPGHVVQVQHKAVPSTTRTGVTTSTSYVATGEYVDFTPKYANSTIYITITIGMQLANTNSGACITNIGRDGTMLGTGSYPIFMRDQTTVHYAPVAGTFVDTPSTTSTVRYEVYIRSSDGGQVFAIHESAYFALVVTEIAA